MILTTHQNNSEKMSYSSILKEKRRRRRNKEKASKLLKFGQILVMGRYLTPCLIPQSMVITAALSA